MTRQEWYEYEERRREQVRFAHMLRDRRVQANQAVVGQKLGWSTIPFGWVKVGFGHPVTNEDRGMISIVQPRPISRGRWHRMMLPY